MMMMSVYKCGKEATAHVARVIDTNDNSEYYAIVRNTETSVARHKIFKKAYSDFDSAQNNLDIMADLKGWRWIDKKSVLPIFEIKGAIYFDVTSGGD